LVDKYRITAVMKIETDIITSIGCDTSDNVCLDLQNLCYCFSGSVIMSLMSHLLIIFSIRVSLLILRISIDEIKRIFF
jgi:hypothetical protein